MNILRNRRAAEAPDEFKEYFDGAKLYGDDFDLAELAEWYADEREGYSKLVFGWGPGIRYLSHLKNVRYGYRFLPATNFEKVLAYGGADGQEFLPILPRIGSLTIVEPTNAFSKSALGVMSLTYVKPGIDGALPLSDNSFDLATCFGVLHHVANCSRATRELYRILRPGGYLLLEEPTISMGDWRKPRPGLTKRERGIPIELLRRMLDEARFETVRERRILFAGTAKLGNFLRVPLQTSIVALRIDELLCSLFSWNVKYHPRTLVEWLMPTNVFYVLRKPKA